MSLCNASRNRTRQRLGLVNATFLQHHTSDLVESSCQAVLSLHHLIGRLCITTNWVLVENTIQYGSDKGSRVCCDMLGGSTRSPILSSILVCMVISPIKPSDRDFQPDTCFSYTRDDPSCDSGETLPSTSALRNGRNETHDCSCIASCCILQVASGNQASF